jgi:hypothetical protein
MANAVTRAAHGLSLPEKRFIAAALAKTDSTDARGLMDADREVVRDGIRRDIRGDAGHGV